MKYVFVYGTLKKGHHNHYGVGMEGSRFVGKHSLAYWKLYSIGIPFAVPSSDVNDVVHGEVYEVSEPVFRNIQALEAGYHEIKLSDRVNGSPIEFYIYGVYNQPRGSRLVEDGVYKRRSLAYGYSH